LGESGDSVLQADVELPREYAPQLPPPVNVKRDFGEYHASYEWKNGILHAERHLMINATEIAVSQYGDYKSFCKVVTDDEDHYIRLVTGKRAAQSDATSDFRSELWKLPDSTNDEALLDEGQGKRALQRRDMVEAAADFKRAVARDPGFTRAWELLGTTLATLNQTDESLDAFRKGAQVDPK
jgi:tetratricopeptide (TPR) repeat protein